MHICTTGEILSSVPDSECRSPSVLVNDLTEKVVGYH